MYASILLQQTTQTFENMAIVAIPNSGWSLNNSTQTAGIAQFASTGYGSAPATRIVSVSASVGYGVYIDTITLSQPLDLGASIGGILTLPTLLAFNELYPRQVSGFIYCYNENGNVIQTIPFNGRAVIPACRYVSFQLISGEVRPSIITTPESAFGVLPHVFEVRQYDWYKWQINFTGDSFVLSCPVNAENLTVTTTSIGSASGTLANRYIKTVGVQVTPNSTTFAAAGYSGIRIGELTPNVVDIVCRDNAAAFIAKPCSVTVFGVRGDKTKTNWAASVNGATLSSTSGDGVGYPAVNAISGNLDPTVGGWWSSLGTTGTRQIEVTFASSKTISEIVLVTLRDAYTTSGIDTVYTTGSLYQAQSFIIYYWNGTAYVAITGGTVTGNTNIMRRFPVSITTTKIAFGMTASPDGYARVVALQAIGPA